MTATCYTCHTAPAGHPDSPYSAYCATCQPTAQPSPRGSECQCGSCGESFTGIGLFDRHQTIDYTHTPAITCMPQEALVALLGLVQDARGVWGTKQGVIARESHATRLAAARARRTEAMT